VALDSLYESGRSIWCALVTTVLVEALLQRKRDDDLHRAQTAMDRLADAPVDPGFVLHEITLLRMRALLARVRGDDSGYLEFRDRYRKMADDLGFEGHKAIAAEM
jgi:adenylate cyclase